MIVTPNVLPLSEVVKPTRPKVKPSDYDGLPFVGLEHVEAHTTRLLGTVPASTMKSNAVHFQPGDVLYSRLRPYLNKVVLADFEGLCSSEFIVLPENEQITGAYLKYLLNSWDFVQFANSLNTGDRPRVDYKQISTFPVYLPSIDEQKETVAAIETQFARLDDAVAALQRSRTRLKQYRASVLKAACEGRLVPTEAELARQEGRRYEPADVLLERIEAERAAAPGKKRGTAKGSEPFDTSRLPELPEGWAWTALGSLIRRSEYGTSTKCDYGYTGPPVLRIPNMIKGKLDYSDLKFAAGEYDVSPEDALQKGDLLICRTNGSIDLVGRSALVDAQPRSDHWFASYLLRFRFFEPMLLPKWVHNYLWSHEARAWIERHAASSAGQNNVSLSLLNSMPVPIPPVFEQERIVEEVERRLSVIDQMATTVEANLKRAESLRQSILRMAFNGRLVRPGLRTSDLVRGKGSTWS